MIEIMYYVHGSTLDNERKKATGWDQISLSVKGIEQTQRAARQIDNNTFDAIFSSDLNRAVESAKILFADRKNDIKVDHRLRECNYGTLTKSSNTELVYEKYVNIPFPCGESLRDVEVRVRDFLMELELNKYKKIAIVSHRAPQLALDVIISKFSWKEAIEKDWRICGHWRLGWHYVCDNDCLNK